MGEKKAPEGILLSGLPKVALGVFRAAPWVHAEIGGGEPGFSNGFWKTASVFKYWQPGSNFRCLTGSG